MSVGIQPWNGKKAQVYLGVVKSIDEEEHQHRQHHNGQYKHRKKKLSQLCPFCAV